MSLDLPPALYDALQRLVHGNYDKAGLILSRMKAEHPGRALELGCGTGIFHRFFEPGTYVGVDVDSGRIELARKFHPGYEFIVGDAAALDPQWLATFSFAFCHASCTMSMTIV